MSRLQPWEKSAGAFVMEDGCLQLQILRVVQRLATGDLGM